MKQWLKTISAAILAVVMPILLPVTTYAEPCPLCIGDADGDYELTVLDATHIQRSLAGLCELSKREAFAADTTGKGYVDIMDATYIQRSLAGFAHEFYTDCVTGLWADVENFYADYASSKAMVGVPVTFGIVGEGKDPLTYEFRIDGKVVRERSEEPTMTYTFVESGTYDITAVVYNGFDENAEYSMWNYEVTEPYSVEKPTITNVYFNHVMNRCSFNAVTVCAVGGAGEYQYHYLVRGEQKSDLFLKDGGDPVWRYDAVLDGFVRENSTEAVAQLPTMDMMQYGGEFTLIVTVTDADGAESEPFSVTFLNEDIPA